MSASSMLRRIEEAELAPAHGYVLKVSPGFVEASGPSGTVGELCDIVCDPLGEHPSVLAEVAAVDERRVVLIPFDAQAPIALGAKVRARPRRDRAPVGDGYSGRAVDALGRPIDGGSRIAADHHAAIAGALPPPMQRVNPSRVLETGLKAIDGLLTLGEGQRIGIFAASGVGKTSLIEQLATQVACDRCTLRPIWNNRKRTSITMVWLKLISPASMSK